MGEPKDTAEALRALRKRARIVAWVVHGPMMQQVSAAHRAALDAGCSVEEVNDAAAAGTDEGIAATRSAEGSAKVQREMVAELEEIAQLEPAPGEPAVSISSRLASWLRRRHS